MKDALFSKVYRGGFATLVVTLAVGCGHSGLELLPVQGRVTLDGKPLADAGVMFLPPDKGPSANGTTDSEGHFELMTVNSIGATRGTHPVVIAKRKYVPIKAGGGTCARWCPCRMVLSQEVREPEHFRLNCRSWRRRQRLSLRVVVEGEPLAISSGMPSGCAFGLRWYMNSALTIIRYCQTLRSGCSWIV